MEDSKLLFLVTLFALSGQFDLSYGVTKDRCSASICQQGEPSIRFPFRLKNLQNESCSYPGFELACNSNGHTVINLPLSGEFIVDFVHYHQQTIWLKDPHDCLPQRLQTFNASGSTLRAANHRSFTFWNCTHDLKRIVPGLRRVGCLSGKDYDVMVLPSDELSGLDPGKVPGCTNPWTIQVPSVPKDLSSSQTIETIGLTWDHPNCGKCEERHETCGLKYGRSKEIICHTWNDEKNSQKRTKLAVMVGMMTPWILLLAFSCYITRKSKAARDRTSTTASPEQVQRVQEMSPVVIGMDSSSTTFGMDSPAIASYPKIQITENTNKLLEPKGDFICAICLLDYCTNDTVKIIPDCNHHFHGHCIDPWLKKKATCPLCRKKQHHRQLQYE